VKNRNLVEPFCDVPERYNLVGVRPSSNERCP